MLTYSEMKGILNAGDAGVAEAIARGDVLSRALGFGGPARLLPRDQQANAVASPERASIAMSRAAEECQGPNGRKWYKIRRFVESEKKVVTVSDQVEKAAGVED